jgi:hypothetical protein
MATEKGAFPEGKFMSCSYGEEGAVLLAKPINDKTSECRVIYEKYQAKLTVGDIVCKLP